MKVCFATYDAPSDIGGVSTWLQRLLPLLLKAGIELEVHVMALGGKPGTNCTIFEQQGIRIRWIPFQWHLPQAVRSLLQLLEDTQPDIYIPNCIVPAYFAAGYARRAGIPTVGVLHSHDPFHWGIVDEFIAGHPVFRVSAVVPVSRFIEAEISSMTGTLGVMVRRIGCGVEIPMRPAEPAGPVFRLVFVGRLVEEAKRISDVTNALCSVAQRIRRLEAWIVGEGPERGAVEKIIREKGMGGRVKLLGRVDSAQIYDVLAQCQGFVLLSDYEGLPISMLEAMATGVVPICLDTRSGVREAIEHDVNGLIVKDRASDFFTAVRDLQGDPLKWRKLSLAARDTVRRRFSIAGCAHQWVDLLHELNGQGSVRSDFRAPRLLRLPPPNPKFGEFGARLPLRGIVKEYIRSNPPIHRMAKTITAFGRKVATGKGTGLGEGSRS